MPDTGWYPSSYYIRPAYSTVPLIRIVDAAVGGFTRWAQRRWWRQQRNKALAMWAAGGLDLKVSESLLPYSNDAITLDLWDVPTGIGAWAAWQHADEYTGPVPDPRYTFNCGWVQIDAPMFASLWQIRKTAKAYANGRLKYLIAHEVGHTLGFGHGGNGIMAAPQVSNRVNEEELRALRDYWFPVVLV